MNIPSVQSSKQDMSGCDLRIIRIRTHSLKASYKNGYPNTHLSAMAMAYDASLTYRCWRDMAYKLATA